MLDRLNELYKKYGDYKTALLTYEFPGVEGMNKIKSLMSFFRDDKVKEQVKGINHIGDYQAGYIYYADRKEETGLPKSDVVKFFLNDNSTITIRPSGTEPKLKIYIFADGQKRVDELKALFEGFIK